MLMRNKTFLPLERVLLESLFKVIPAETVEYLKKQISTIKKIQRICGNKEINLYYQPQINSREAAANRIMPCIGESKLATIKFVIPDNNTNIDVDFWLVNGYLFSLNFSKSPDKNIRNDKIVIQDILLHQENKYLREHYLEIIQSIIGLIKKSKKFPLDDWEIFERNNVTTVKFGKEEFYILAKHYCEPRFLLVNCNDGEIYYIEHEDEKPRLLEDK